jgi:membrane-associated protease RseP (regulator of RpoE activity)
LKTTNLKTALQISFLFLFALPQIIFAQEKSRIFNKIPLKTTTVNNDSTSKTAEVIDVENLDHAIYILDSILNKNGIDFSNIKNILGDYELDSNNIDDLDKIIAILTKDFNHIFDLSPAPQKAVLGVVIDDYSRITEGDEVHPIISEVIINSAAEHAGLLKDDILFKINQKEVHSIQDIMDVMKDKKEGDHLDIHYIRDLDTIVTRANLHACKNQTNNWFSLFQDNMSSEDSCNHSKGKPFCEKILIQKSGPRLGVKVTNLDEEAKKALKAKKGGAMITKVQPRSVAEQMNLQLNDVITNINGQEILNIAELKNYVNHLPMPQEIKVQYIRYGKKKKASGTIHEFSKPWDDNELMNVIDMSKFPTE